MVLWCSLGKKEVPHECDCRGLFIVHHFVDFAGRYRGSGCRHQGQHGKYVRWGIVLGAPCLGHHGQHLGAGNDYIDAYDNAVVDAGTGNDTVTTYSHATVSAGAGDDHVRTNDYSVVDGGAGDDAIQVGGSSTVTGGAGDDYIRVTGDNSTINFAKGDGSDVVRVDDGSDSVDFSISGYSQDDVIVTQQPGRTTVSFKGSGDSLVFDHGSNGSARLSFADHTSVDIRA
jgi:hypothetical protein